MMRLAAIRQRTRSARVVPVAAPPGLARPLGTVRRRLVLRALLLGALWAAAANLAVLGACEALNRALGLDLHTPFFAEFVLAVLAVRALRGLRLREAAAALDASAGLKDRLVTAVELAAAPAVDAEMRDAQLAETLARVRGVDAARHPPLHPLLWSGPALFGGLLALAAYLSFISQDPLRISFELAPGLGTRAPAPSTPGGSRATRRERPALPAAEPAPGPAHGTSAAGPAGSQTPPAPAPGGAPGDRTPAVPIPQGDPALPAPPGAPERREGGRMQEAEPARLTSETVGTALTPVGDAAPGGGGGAIPVPRGRVSFNLIPRQELEGADGRGGAGGGATARAIEVVVDFDALAPEHREHVRRYFEALQRP